MIHEDDKPGHMAWTKAGQLIGFNTASLFWRKYDFFVTYHSNSMVYTLVIKNINLADLNLVYKCESGFSFAEGILPLNEETFVGRYIHIKITVVGVFSFDIPYKELLVSVYATVNCLGSYYVMAMPASVYRNNL